MNLRLIMISGVPRLRLELLRSLKLLSGLLVLLSVVGCAASMKPLEVQTKSLQIEKQHPPLPPPIFPAVPQVIVVTPEVSAEWNQEIIDGERLPYVVYGFDEQDWLTLGQYDENVVAYIKKLLSIIKNYGHPDLQDKP